MSHDLNVLVRRAFSAYNRGGVDPALKDFAPEFECDMSRAVGFNVDRESGSQSAIAWPVTGSSAGDSTRRRGGTPSTLVRAVAAGSVSA